MIEIFLRYGSRMNTHPGFYSFKTNEIKALSRVNTEDNTGTGE
jgi:hypothetical protein